MRLCTICAVVWSGHSRSTSRSSPRSHPRRCSSRRRGRPASAPAPCPSRRAVCPWCPRTCSKMVEVWKGLKLNLPWCPCTAQGSQFSHFQSSATAFSSRPLSVQPGVVHVSFSPVSHTDRRMTLERCGNRTKICPCYRWFQIFHFLNSNIDTSIRSKKHEKILDSGPSSLQSYTECVLRILELLYWALELVSFHLTESIKN